MARERWRLPPVRPRKSSLNVRAPAEEIDEWEEASRLAQARSTNAWVRDVLNQAARSVIEQGKQMR